MKGKPVRALGALAVVALALGASGIARGEAKKPVKTKVQLGLVYNGSTETRFYSVLLDSKKAKCLNERDVHVFLKLPGNDALVGAIITNEEGRGEFPDQPGEPFVSGDRYVAKALKKGKKCAEGKSEQVGF